MQVVYILTILEVVLVVSIQKNFVPVHKLKLIVHTQTVNKKVWSTPQLEFLFYKV